MNLTQLLMFNFALTTGKVFLVQLNSSIIDTGLLPQITLEIQLADDAVCPAADTADLDIDAFASGAAPLGHLSVF
jgi:hypothetical protein